MEQVKYHMRQENPQNIPVQEEDTRPAKSSFIIWGFLVTQTVKNLPAIQSREDPLQKQMAIHSSVLAWRIPWTNSFFKRRKMGVYAEVYCIYFCVHSHRLLQVVPWRVKMVANSLTLHLEVKESESEVAQSCPTLRPHVL